MVAQSEENKSGAHIILKVKVYGKHVNP